MWFFAYFGQNLIAMATSFISLQSEMSSSDWPTMKTSVISNYLLVISRRNAFIAILVAKLAAMVTPLCPLCTGVSQMNSPVAKNRISKPNSAWICHIQLKLWPFLWNFFAYFFQNLVAMATYPLDWLIPKTCRTKNFVSSCYTSEVMWIGRFATSLALRE